MNELELLRLAADAAKLGMSIETREQGRKTFESLAQAVGSQEDALNMVRLAKQQYQGVDVRNELVPLASRYATEPQRRAVRPVPAPSDMGGSFVQGLTNYLAQLGYGAQQLPARAEIVAADLGVSGMDKAVAQQNIADLNRIAGKAQEVTDVQTREHPLARLGGEMTAGALTTAPFGPASIPWMTGLGAAEGLVHPQLTATEGALYGAGAGAAARGVNTLFRSPSYRPQSAQNIINDAYARGYRTTPGIALDDPRMLQNEMRRQANPGSYTATKNVVDRNQELYNKQFAKALFGNEAAPITRENVLRLHDDYGSTIRKSYEHLKVPNTNEVIRPIYRVGEQVTRVNGKPSKKVDTFIDRFASLDGLSGDSLASFKSDLSKATSDAFAKKGSKTEAQALAEIGRIIDANLVPTTSEFTGLAEVIRKLSSEYALLKDLEYSKAFDFIHESIDPRGVNRMLVQKNRVNPGFSDIIRPELTAQTAFMREFSPSNAAYRNVVPKAEIPLLSPLAQRAGSVFMPQALLRGLQFNPYPVIGPNLQPMTGLTLGGALGAGLGIGAN